MPSTFPALSSSTSRREKEQFRFSKSGHADFFQGKIFRNVPCVQKKKTFSTRRVMALWQRGLDPDGGKSDFSHNPGSVAGWTEKEERKEMENSATWNNGSNGKKEMMWKVGSQSILRISPTSISTATEWFTIWMETTSRFLFGARRMSSPTAPINGPETTSTLSPT